MASISNICLSESYICTLALKSGKTREEASNFTSVIDGKKVSWGLKKKKKKTLVLFYLKKTKTIGAGGEGKR